VIKFGKVFVYDMEEDEKNIPTHVVAVMAVVQKGDKFLIAKRAGNDPQAGGQWSTPGGKVDMEKGFGIIENELKREIMEEVGLEVEDKFVYLGSEGFTRVSGHHVIALIFLAKWKGGEAKPLEHQEEIKWVTLKQLEEMKDLPDYMQNRIKQLHDYIETKKKLEVN
jgi:ADP-ribose pyrophosphatase YjhB (NUDIX family)